MCKSKTELLLIYYHVVYWGTFFYGLFKKKITYQFLYCFHTFGTSYSFYIPISFSLSYAAVNDPLT